MENWNWNAFRFCWSVVLQLLFWSPMTTQDMIARFPHILFIQILIVNDLLWSTKLILANIDVLWFRICFLGFVVSLDDCRTCWSFFSEMSEFFLCWNMWVGNIEAEDERVVAVLVDEKDGYGGQWEGFKTSLAPSIMKPVVSRLVKATFESNSEKLL